MKKLTRKAVSRLVYVIMVLAVVGLSFLMVWISVLIFDAREDKMMDTEVYRAVNIVSAQNVGKPLSLAVRVQLFNGCEVEGEPRKKLPDELSEADAVSSALDLWYAILYSYSAGQSTLASGDSVSRLWENTKTTAVLRDYSNAETGAHYSLWCIQAYCDSESGQTYCMSVLLDSRTGDPMYLSCALFENINEVTYQCGIFALLTALGYGEEQNISWSDVNSGRELTVDLGNGLKLVKTSEYGSQFIMHLVYSD